MTVTISGTDGITTPGLTNTGTETLVNLTTTGNTTLGDASGDTLTVTGGTTTFTQGTANGVAYLNGSKVLTTGSALVFDGTNLGVGTTSPAAKFDAFQSSVGTYFLGGGGDNKARQLAITSSTTTNSGDTHTINAQSGTGILAFAISSSEKARIDTSGNLLVGQTSVNQTGNGVAIQYSGDASNLSRISVGGTGAGTGYSLYSVTASAFRFYVSYAGQIYATSTSITAISDASLKTNIKDLETGLTQVMALKPRRFDWINGDATNVAGFIAQEVAEVLPELVDDYIYNTDENGNNIIKKSLKMGDILPTLVKAIQEQQALITTLTDRITALENK